MFEFTMEMFESRMELLIGVLCVSTDHAICFCPCVRVVIGEGCMVCLNFNFDALVSVLVNFCS